jgi:hypothetical protein
VALDANSPNQQIKCIKTKMHKNYPSAATFPGHNKKHKNYTMFKKDNTHT